MSFFRTILGAAVLGGLVQSGVTPTAKPRQSSAEKNDVAVVRIAENLFGAIQSEVRKGLEAPLESRDISSGDLTGIVAMLDSCAAKLREAGLEDKLNRAVQRAELVQTQALAVLKDPGNKEVLARDLHPDDYVNQINYQKASAVILERKIQRLRNVSEEIRKYAVIMEGVIPPDQLSPRIRMRLTQLLREWNNEPEQAIGGEIADESETGSQSSNRAQTRAKNRSLDTKSAAQVVSSRVEIRLSGPAETVVQMSRQRSNDKSILKFIGRSPDPFEIGSAGQILLLRDLGVSTNAISAMLRRDGQLRGNVLSRGGY
jgi:hypothetical protein